VSIYICKRISYFKNSQLFLLLHVRFSESRSPANFEVFGEVTMCRLVIGSRRFKGAYRLHSQGSSGVPGPLKTKKNSFWVT